VAGNLPNLKNLILFDEITEANKENAKKANLTLYHISEVIAKGKATQDQTLVVPKKDTCIIFCYTSGTTGDPKAVMLNHSHFLCMITESRLVNFFTWYVEH
jgi:long-subunit acyl-CoA synthetase (AMP-forming)